jgi:hypothetical protein
LTVDINNLWELRDQNEWLDALDRYWVDPAVCRNRDTEQFMHKVKLEYIQKLDMQEWYDFLNKYFRWKFTGSQLHTRLMDLDKNSFEHLFSVKRGLLALDRIDLADSRKCLNLVRSPRIRGLDYPSASGLLALMFKEWYGSVDRGVLESLCKIEALPEKSRIGEIRAWVKVQKDWRESDAVLVINMVRRKAAQLNAWFGANRWTPHKITMILRTSNRPVWAEHHKVQMVRRGIDEHIPPQS